MQRSILRSGGEYRVELKRTSLGVVYDPNDGQRLANCIEVYPFGEVAT